MTDTFFTTNARADPDAAFVGRERELREMIARVERGAQTLAITGERGLGKTALAYAFAANTERVFPGGTIRTQGLPFTPRDDSLFQQIQDRVRRGRTLIVIDDADLFEERYFSGLLYQLREMRDVVTVAVLTRARRHEAFDLTIHLEQLPFEEIEAMLLARFPRSAARRTLQVLREQVDVSPRLALELANYLVVHGEGSDLNELLARWHSFKQSGLLGPDGTPLRRDTQQAKQIVIDVVSVNTELLSILNSHPDLLRKVPTRRFEEIVAELLHRLGYEVELTPAIKDGGFDMYAAKKDALGKFLFLVECKRYSPSNKVGVEIARSLHGVVQDKKASAGVLVTTSFFTEGAKEFQSRNRYELQLKDYMALREWLRAAVAR